MLKHVLLLTLAAATLSAADDDKPRRRVRLGGISVGAGYSHFNGPWFPYGYGYSPYWGPAWMSAWRAPWIGSYWFDPFFMTPYIHPAFYTGFGFGPNLGEVRLRTFDKSADVYLDGALAGKAGKLKSMWLEPGAYELTIQSGDQIEYTKKIYVLTGKRFDVQAERTER